MTDVGRQRDHNEDSFAVLEEQGLFIVADGMGGHRAGDVASRLATESIADFFRASDRDDVTWPFHFDVGLTEDENRLATGIRIANRQIFERSLRSRDCQGMGTTVVGALYSRKRQRLVVGHVGDSRAYRIRAGAIDLLTRDHSLVNEYLLAMPDLSEEQRAELPRNVITRALGMQDNVLVDLLADQPLPGDVYVLCSDGLSGMLADEEILALVELAGEPHEACRRLIDEANEKGGDDNITALVIRFVDGNVEDTTDDDEATIQMAPGDLETVPMSERDTALELPAGMPDARF